jgi:hypothetical protein
MQHTLLPAARYEVNFTALRATEKRPCCHGTRICVQCCDQTPLLHTLVSKDALAGEFHHAGREFDPTGPYPTRRIPAN